jgi:hypothetical protein
VYHTLRFTFYVLRFTFYVLRFTFYVLRFTFYVLRFTFYILDGMDLLDPTTGVLVAVVTRPRDLELARAAGWYRVPLRSAPRGLACAVLAFYQTAAFGAERWSVRYAAPVLSVDIALRRELLPGEAGHPRAGERYYRLALGPLWALPAPVPSRRLRRITFIATTLGQLLRARDVAELWRPPDAPAPELWGGGVRRR